MSRKSDYVPPSMPWELSEVLIELLKKALYLLKPGGRLVYWLPTVVDEYQESDVPVLTGLRLVANSEQNFGKWSRRVSESVAPVVLAVITANDKCS